jgi:predicted RecA/RadA family phage recombinase
MALTTVNTEGITNGTIKDEDVKTNAAIAGSKIAPDFGSQNITTTGLIEVASTSCHIDLMETSATNHRIRNGSGNFHIQRISDDKNTTETQLLIDGGTGAIELHYDGDSKKLETTSTGVSIDGKLFVGTTALDSFASSLQYNAGASGSFICLGRNDTTVADANGIGGIRFFSNDTNINSGNYLRVGEITCAADGDFLSGDAPTKMTFSTMTDGTTTLETRMTIDSSGNVGIGEDSPNSILHLGAADNSDHEAILTLNNGGATGQEAGIEWLYESSTTPRAKIWLNSSGQDLRFATANAERLRITSGGQIYLGPYKTTTVGYNVPYEIRVAPYDWGSSQDLAAISIGNHSGATGSDDGQIVFKTALNCHTDASALQERLRILSQGGITFNGETAVANALDHYEEGIFVPTLGGSTGDPTQDYAHKLGSFVRIGNVVHVSFDVKMASSGVSAGSGVLLLGSLPYTKGSHTGGTPSHGCTFSAGFTENLGSDHPTAAFIDNGQNYLWMRKTSSSSSAYCSATAITNSTRIIAGATYITTQ